MFLFEETSFERPYIQIVDGVLKKYIADEDGIVTIPDCVEVIAENVFSWYGMPEDQFEDWEAENDQCIRKIHIPANVKRIEPGAFVDTFYLKALTVDPECPAAALVDGLLLSKDGSRVIFATPELDLPPVYTLPSTVKVIDSCAFLGRSFSELILPDSVEEIGAQAFAYSFFHSITIPDSVTRLGAGAFTGCHPDRTSLHIGENSLILKMDDFGLYDKSGEQLIFIYAEASDHVEIPAGVRCIESTAFSWQRPKSVTLPEGMQVLPDRLFFWNRWLEELHLPDSLLSIGTDAFTGCKRLKKVKMSSGLKQILPYAFNACCELESLELPATVQYIGKNAFINCEKLVIRAPAGSYAITYAKENGIPFLEL